MRENTVRLGLMPPLTGLVEMYGAEISRAGQIACEEINESGGVLGRPLELVIEDDGSLPESAVAAAARLVDQHRCVAIIGNLLSNSRIAVAYQVAEPRRIPYLNFSFYEGSILSRYFFHFAALPNQQIDRMIPYMRNHFGPRMFFAGNNYEWPRGSIDAAKRALEQSGGLTVGEEYYPIGAGDGDIERLLDQVAESRAEVFVPYFAGTDQTHLLTRFTARGLKKRMAVVMGHYDEAMASRLPPEVREGFYSSNTYFMTLDTPENKAYLARLAAQPGVNGIWPQGNGILTNFGEGTYLCVKAFAKAANLAGNLGPEALVNALETIAVSGPQGTVQMDPVSHHAQVNTCLSRCEADGSFTIIERFGAIPPVLPERYRHLQIGKQSELEDVYLQSRMMAQITEAVLLAHATNGAIVYANPGAERMFGYESGKLPGKHFSELFAPSGKSPEETTAAIGAVLSRKGVWQGETEHIARDGKHFWCAASISVFTHPKHGEVWMILNRDITERKQAEESIRISQARFSTIFNQAPLGIALIDSFTGRIYEVNPRFAEIAGRTIEEMMTIDWMSITHPDDVQADLDNMALLNAGKISGFNMDKRYIRPDGSFVWINMTIAPLRVEQNISPRHLCMIDDITERKQVEAALQQNQAELQEAQRIAHAGSWRLDRMANHAVWSEELYRIFGLNPELPPPGYAEQHSLFTPGSWKRLSVALLHTQKTGTPYELELEIIRADKKHGWVLARGEALQNPNNIITGLHGIAMDITELKQAEENVRRLNSELEQRVAERTAELESFSYSVSHDLRTPLRAIDGFSNLVLKRYEDKLDDEGKRLLNAVRDNTKKMGQLIDDILAFSRAGRLEIKASKVNMEVLAREVWQDAAPLIAGRDVRLDIKPLPKVQGDPAMLRQVWANLLGNAAKFTHLQAAARIEVGGSVSGNECTFYVRDNGAGFDPQYMHKLFGVFQRLHAVDEFEGTGIGLAIVKRIVTRHNGRVWAEGKINEGATFYFALPYKEGQS